MGVLGREPAHRGAPHVHVEDAPLQLGGLDEVGVAEGGLGEAHAARVEAVGALVDGHSPAGVVILGLADQGVLRLDQLVPDRGRLRRYAAEHAAHDAQRPYRGAKLAAIALTGPWKLPTLEPRRIWWARPRKLCALERPGEGGATTAPRGGRPRSRTCAGAACGWWCLDDALAPQPGRTTRRPGSTGTTCRWRRPQDGADALEELLPLLRRELAATRGGGDARRQPHRLRGRGLRRAPARGRAAPTRPRRSPGPRAPASPSRRGACALLGVERGGGGWPCSAGRVRQHPRASSPTATGWGSKPSSVAWSAPSLQHERGVQARRGRRGEVGVDAIADHERRALAEPVERGQEQLRLRLADDLGRAPASRTPRRRAMAPVPGQSPSGCG